MYVDNTINKNINLISTLIIRQYNSCKRKLLYKVHIVRI